MADVMDPRPLGLQNPVVYREVALVGSGVVADVPTGPTLSVGTGAPTHTRPAGSIYLRKDGAADAYIYVTSGAGVWIAVENAGGNVALPDGGILSFGAGNDVTLTHDGVTTVNIAGILEWQDDQAATFGDDADGSIQFTSATPALDVTIASAALNLGTTTAGNVNITAADDINLLATGSDVDIDAATLTADFTGVMSLDAVGNSNITVDAGDLNLATTTSGSLELDGIDGVNIESGAGVIRIGADNIAQDIAIGSAGARNIDVGGATTASLDLEAGIGGATLTADTTINLSAGGALAGAIILDATDAAGGIDIDAGTGGIAVNTDGNMTITPLGLADITTADATGSGAGPATSNVTLSTGTRIIDDAAGSPASGDLIIQTGNTDCTDGAGTAGDTGALTIQTGDADSVAGASGNSGILTIETGFSDDANSGALNLVTGNADTNSGNVTIDVGAAGGTAGNIILGTTAVLIEMDTLTRFDAAGGATPAAALLAGAGTYANPATTAVADQNMLEFRTQSTANAGDFRGLYMQADMAGVGVGGDAVRGRALITAAGTAGTVDGGAFTTEYNGGSVAGMAAGLRGNLVVSDAPVVGGTVYGTLAEIYALGGATDLAGATQHAILGIEANGDGTGVDTVLNAVAFRGNTDGGGKMINSHDPGAGNATGSIRILVNGVVRYLHFWDVE